MFIDGVVRNKLWVPGGLRVYRHIGQVESASSKERSLCDMDSTNIQQVDGSQLSVMGVAWVDVQLGRTTFPVRAILPMSNMTVYWAWISYCHWQKFDFLSLELRLNGERLKCTSSTGEPFMEGAGKHGNSCRSRGCCAWRGSHYL